MIALILEDLHVLQLIIFLQFIEFVVVLFQESQQLSIVIFSLLNVNVATRKCILQKLILRQLILLLHVSLQLDILSLLCLLVHLQFQLHNFTFTYAVGVLQKSLRLM